MRWKWLTLNRREALRTARGAARPADLGAVDPWGWEPLLEDDRATRIARWGQEGPAAVTSGEGGEAPLGSASTPSFRYASSSEPADAAPNSASRQADSRGYPGGTTGPWPRRAYPWYLGAVSASGITALAVVLVLADWTAVARSPWQYALFAFFVVLGELSPIRIARHRSDDMVTVSTAFAFAVLIAFGPGPAIALYAGASIVGDLVSRSPAPRIVFNAGQYTLSLGAGAGLLALIAQLPYTAESIPVGLPAIFAGAAVYFLANTVLAGTAAALYRSADVMAYLRRDLGFQMLTSGLLLAISPVIVITAEASLVLVPLLFLPTLAIYWSGRQSLISEHRALHDVLTGLPNRSLLHDRLEHDLALGRREGTSVGVMILDLDDFKDINDTLGHHHGDLVLQAIGPRLGEVLRETDTLARLGGDEFAVILPHISGPDDAITVAAKLTRALERPFSIAGLWLDVRTSIGIARFPADGENVGSLLRRADVALYKAKNSKTDWELYSPEEDEYTRERLALAAELRRGIAGDELELRYQPKLALPGGELKDVEALVRWRHPLRGLLSPDAFIPLAEQTGLIRPLTERVLDLALRQARCWREAGLDLRVSVNISTRSLGDRRLALTLRELVNKWSLDASTLQLEITESALIGEGRRATAALEELSSLGIRLAIDDFGTGYSSLTYLKRLPVSEIKIDKSFVSQMTTSREDSVIVRSTIELARDLGLDTTAEGVEQEATCRQLADWGCHFAQGFLLAPPVECSEVIEEAERGRQRLIQCGEGPVRTASLPRLAAVPAAEASTGRPGER